MEKEILGQAVPRVEDQRLIRGDGRFVGDFSLPGMLHLAVLRSPHAHARILSIETAAARSAPGVVAVVTFADIAEIAQPIPLYQPNSALKPALPYPLAREKTRYVGEPVAAVVAESRYLAEDALELIEVAYEPLPAVASCQAALADGAPLVHEELGSNLAARLEVNTGGPVEAAFAQADVIVKARLTIGRQSPQPLETRGCLALWDPDDGLSVWDATQSVHMVRRMYSTLLGLPEEKVRVRAPDVGGGFGGKNRFYPEEFLTGFLAMRTGRPVKWIADRREDLLAMYQERGQEHEAELALARDGTILGLRDSFWADQGAYTPFGVVIPMMTLSMLAGPYRVPAFHGVMHAVYTTRAGMAPYRGAGRPQASYVIERLLDLAARRLGMDPAELRLKNLVRPDQQPWNTGVIRDQNPVVYDGGDYPAALRQALDLIGHEEFRAAQREARRQGRCLGLGTGVAVEMSAVGPTEGARVTVDPAGRVTVFTGAASQGQGSETTLAQVCAQRLGCSLADVRVVLGDTAGIAHGGGTWASRTAVAAGNAVGAAAAAVRRKAIALAAALLEVDPHDLIVAEGRVFVEGAPHRGLTLGELSRTASYPNFDPKLRWPGNKHLPWGDAPGLDATEWHKPDFTFGYVAQAAIVEVDPRTGMVQLQKVSVVHDCGRVLNPTVVEGQVCGALAQGIGGALYEEIVTDERGQVLTGSMMDYLMPTAAEMPGEIKLGHLVTPSANPEGVRGAGEGAIIPLAAVICGAVDDALSDWGVFCTQTPITPARLLQRLATGPRQAAPVPEGAS